VGPREGPGKRKGDDILDRRDHSDTNLDEGKDSLRVAFCCFEAKATTCPPPMPISSPYSSSPSLSLLLRHQAPPSPKGHSHQPLTLPTHALPSPLTLFPHPLTLFPHPLTLFPHPLTLFPHPLTCRYRRCFSNLSELPHSNPSDFGM